MQEFGTFQSVGFDGHTRTWHVSAEIDSITYEIDFIRLQYGTTSLPGPALRPNECVLPHQIAGLSHVRAAVNAGGVEHDDFELIDTGG